MLSWTAFLPWTLPTGVFKSWKFESLRLGEPQTAQTYFLPTLLDIFWYFDYQSTPTSETSVWTWRRDKVHYRNKTQFKEVRNAEFRTSVPCHLEDRFWRSCKPNIFHSREGSTGNPAIVPPKANQRGPNPLHPKIKPVFHNWLLA